MTGTITRATYFPCAVQTPDERLRRRQYVILAEGGVYSGLHSFTRPGMVGEIVLPIDWTATPPLPSGRATRNGVFIHLADGRIVTLTPGTGCRCGTLGRWPGPPWAHTVATR